MSNFSYYITWLAAGLAIIAVVSAGIARHLRMRVLRRMKAGELLSALAGYSEWLTAQRGSAFFQGTPPEVDLALREMDAAFAELFRELDKPARELLAVHQRVVDFLQSQQSLRLEDPEAWLVSEHDSRFADLWRQHVAIAGTLGKHLKRVVDTEDASVRRGTIFPA